MELFNLRGTKFSVLCPYASDDNHEPTLVLAMCKKLEPGYEFYTQPMITLSAFNVNAQTLSDAFGNNAIIAHDSEVDKLVKVLSDKEYYHLFDVQYTASVYNIRTDKTNSLRLDSMESVLKRPTSVMTQSLTVTWK